MNAVEIEEAVSALADQPFDAEEFPYAFLEAFGNKETTIKRLRNGSSNGSDLPGGVLQRNNIHISVCDEGAVSSTLSQLRESPATGKQKAKFILSTDGISFEAENLVDGEYGRNKLDSVTFHSTRHSFTTRMMRVADMATVQSFTGHSNKEMVAIYAHADPESRRRAMERMYQGDFLGDIYNKIKAGEMTLEQFKAAME